MTGPSPPVYGWMDGCTQFLLPNSRHWLRGNHGFYTTRWLGHSSRLLRWTNSLTPNFSAVDLAEICCRASARCTCPLFTGIARAAFLPVTEMFPPPCPGMINCLCPNSFLLLARLSLIFSLFFPLASREFFFPLFLCFLFSPVPFSPMIILCLLFPLGLPRRILFTPRGSIPRRDFDNFIFEILGILFRANFCTYSCAPAPSLQEGRRGQIADQGQKFQDKVSI